jgi:thiamine biosynthesis lipoprotein
MTGVFLSETSMNLHFIARLVVLTGVLAAAGGCRKSQPQAAPAASRPALSRFEYAKIYMGVRTRLVVYATDETAAVNACTAAFDRVGRVEDAASDYRPQSEVMKLCRTATTRPVKLSDDLFRLLSEGQKVARLTDGAFDMTVGPYVTLWRKARQEKKLPSAEALAEASKRVGWRKLTIDEKEQTARLAVKGMKLDLGGIAKGYAGDCALQTLREHGVTSALFEAGGDIVVSEAPPGEEGWKIELIDAGPAMPKTVTVHNCGVSTSGDTEQFVEIGGKHYSHVVDPRTGIGLTARAMATVVSPKGVWSDPLSKPATMLSEEKLAEVLKEYPGAKAWRRVVGE